MNVIVVGGMVVIFLLAWGFIGSSQVAEAGNTCDLGINGEGSVFCWKWHRNIVGDIQDRFGDLLDK